LVSLYQLKKVKKIIVGGCDRQDSLLRGINEVYECGAEDEDIVVIHDGVRPLVDEAIIQENIRVAKKYGSAITVHPVTESVVITDEEDVQFSDFKKRADTYSMTSPQSFQLGKIREAYDKVKEIEEEIPLLDAAMVYSRCGGEIHLVKEHGTNIKITTPEDFYFLKAILELEENKYIFGL